ncbi:hypothetical protein PQC07_gp123 [Aeromonas phage D3]|uniref:Uncharacterized protein n=1 Tax=Aeromonas phage D3 TaxID=2593327 RepID=A0A514TW05_9CAUD|nr:hypothetical protein PQC07_gp123 [Aeromonas phage D3]QDJ97150.1 hypothetical protein D3_0152 [Aeromonas phage D3]
MKTEEIVNVLGLLDNEQDIEEITKAGIKSVRCESPEPHWIIGTDSVALRVRFITSIETANFFSISVGFVEDTEDPEGTFKIVAKSDREWVDQEYETLKQMICATVRELVSPWSPANPDPF